jgi:hypothetical protein
MASKAQQMILVAWSAELSEDRTRGKLTLRGTRDEVIELLFPAAEFAKFAATHLQLSAAARRLPSSE